MEKVIYLLWRDPAVDADAFGEQLRAQLAPQLREAGARHLRLNLADSAVTPAIGLRQQHLKPAPDAVVQVWLDSAIRALRAAADAAIAAAAPRHSAWLVTESQPMRNREHPAAAGTRTHGFAQIAILRKPLRLAYADWLDVWHNSHTEVAKRTQSTFEYVQNVVVRPLTAEAPAIDAIVEECFPPGAMTDYKVFFGAPGDEAKFKRNLAEMMQSVHRFIEPGSIDVIPTSQYDMF
ncbi:MAG TPA: hypothetical protein VM074_13190 [Solimonas sp.]|nr:hypothetical protein [Solimonas sp.]